MTTIYLIRHGQAARGRGEHADPELTTLGQQQAQEAARALSDRGPLPIVVSPLRRARETAAPLEILWNRTARIDPRVAEIPSPAPGMTLAQRAEWLNTLPQRRWHELGAALVPWRREVIECLLSIATDTVVVSHSLVINAVVSWAQADERVVCRQPLPGSCTTLERVADTFRVLDTGREGVSTVL